MIRRIWTIGHSTREIDVFLSLLNENGIKLIADVRMYPGSKRYPHFGREALAKSLSDVGIRYEHFPELGGRRKANPDSKNTAWRNEMFRGYADYMETEDFQKGIARLVDLAGKTGSAALPASSTPACNAVATAGRRSVAGVAIMCAEAVWWRCHRSLVSDYLKARGVEVLHILDHNKVEPHPFTSAARIVNGELSYREETLL
ncbi:MAG: hypothetical protein DME57_09355 [Verrucomicrobia bacterium]|nr:MAG: hypothetical protein DME57_09355 [Verrucomicrobiota bacterium]